MLLYILSTLRLEHEKAAFREAALFIPVDSMQIFGQIDQLIELDFHQIQVVTEAANRVRIGNFMRQCVLLRDFFSMRPLAYGEIHQSQPFDHDRESLQFRRIQG